MYISILAEQFCEHSLYIKGYSNHTVKRYRQFISYYRRFAKIEQLEEVTTENIRALFFHGRTERNWSPGTFLSCKMALVVFFRWCIKQGYMQENPVQDIETPRLQKKLPPRLLKEDAVRLLEVIYNYPYEHSFIRHRNHAIFATFIFAGLRRGELLKLKFTDVDTEHLTIFVRQGKGNKDRIVPMNFTLAQILRKYTDERKKLKKTCPEFFVSYTNNCGLSNMGLRHIVEGIRRATNIKFYIHLLRHTFATLMLEGGCDIYSLSRMMGHSDIKTTTIYLAASAEHLRSQVSKHPLINLLNKI